MEAVKLKHMTVYYYTPLKLSDMEGLLKAARLGDLDEVISLVSGGEDVNKIGPQYGLTPLHLSSLHGHLEVVQFLLDNGAKVNAVDDWLCTPLHNAAGAGHPEVARELLEAGASLDSRSANKSKTPLDLARDKNRHAVIPVLNEFMSKRSRLKMNEGARETEAERSKSVAQPAKDGSIVVRWKDKEAQLNGGNSNNNNPSGQDVGVEAASYGGAGRQQQQQQQKQSVHAPLPGLIEEAEVEYEASGRGRGMEQPRAVSSAKMNAEKKALQEQLKVLERQEQIYRLSKEKSIAQDKMSSMRNSYASQLDSLQKAISEMQQKISNLADERDSELTSMEEKLDQIDHNIYELERAPQGESNGKKIPAVTVLSK